ncbi:hypothetical protein CEUSTIGMA_g10228.t1 [Chlamydomonas eustigma]|uniref:sn-1-specific diacylglycerol lipase n=1 Tax=Chlamydomonas eustigma TaxID=1157962 RepID=A0A250XIS2_9CHLO|nr:hypothetical protein CEUSTIGMA_g10228.t1 [Chlamydomonas eustigma]|eukprot:GAX82802.1 hypothetical protein CEUSTIGMA_g10228.t1 [Chlamydomonas eustigma]
MSLLEATESQRFYGVVWGPPLPLIDWPNWNDGHGNNIHLPRPPSIDGEQGWFVVRLPSTDHDGWLYGTAFDHLQNSRPGGRASKRGSDHVRCRVWRRLHMDQDLMSQSKDPRAFSFRAHIAARQHALEDDLIDGGKAGNHQGIASIRHGAKLVSSKEILSALTNNLEARLQPKVSMTQLWTALMELWNESAQRHGVLKVVPLDPVGLLLAVRQHREYAASVKRSQLASGRTIAKSQHCPAAATLATASVAIASGTSSAEPHVGVPVPIQHREVAEEVAGEVAEEEVTEGLKQERGEKHFDRLTISRAQEELGIRPTPPSSHALNPSSCSNTQTQKGGGRLVKERSPTNVAAQNIESNRRCALDAVPTVVESLRGAHAGRAWIPAQSPAAKNLDIETNTEKVQKEPSASNQQEGLLLPGFDLLVSDPDVMVSELVAATNYARAAYGYVLAAGHMSSISSLFKMVSSSAFFDPVTGASVEANNEAIEALTGIPKEDIFKAEWRNTVFRPCHFLAVDRKNKRLVLSIRGSLELGDICTDLAAQLQPWDLSDQGLGTILSNHEGLSVIREQALPSQQHPRRATAGAADAKPTDNCAKSTHHFSGGMIDRMIPGNEDDNLYGLVWGAVGSRGVGHNHLSEVSKGAMGRVHKGLLSAAKYVGESVSEALETAVRTNPGWPLLITGHSLGAGVAAIMALLLRHRQKCQLETSSISSNGNPTSPSVGPASSIAPQCHNTPATKIHGRSRQSAVIRLKGEHETATPPPRAVIHKAATAGGHYDSNRLTYDSPLTPADNNNTVRQGFQASPSGKLKSSLLPDVKSRPGRGEEEGEEAVGCSTEKFNPSTPQQPGMTEALSAMMPAGEPEEGQGNVDSAIKAAAEASSSATMVAAALPVLPLTCCVYSICIAPPPTLSLELAEACSDCVMTLVHEMDFVSRLSQYSVEMALMDMVRSSPALQLADNLMAQIEEGKAAWESLKTGFLEGVKALKGAGGNITRSGSSMLKKFGTSLERNHRLLQQGLLQQGSSMSGLPLLRRSSDPSGGGGSSPENQRLIRGEASPSGQRLEDGSVGSSPSVEPLTDGQNLHSAASPRQADDRNDGGLRWEALVESMANWLGDTFDISGTSSSSEHSSESWSAHLKEESKVGLLDSAQSNTPSLPVVPGHVPELNAADTTRSSTAHVLHQAMDDLEDEMAKQAEASGSRPSPRKAAKELQTHLPAQKLYLPGIILWLIEEEEDDKRRKEKMLIQQRVMAQSNYNTMDGDVREIITRCQDLASGGTLSGVSGVEEGEQVSLETRTPDRSNRGCRHDGLVVASADLTTPSSDHGDSVLLFSLGHEDLDSTGLVFAGDFGPSLVSLHPSSSREDLNCSPETVEMSPHFKKQGPGGKISGTVEEDASCSSVTMHNIVQKGHVTAESTSEEDSSAANNRPAGNPLCLVVADRSSFELLALVPSCATDHMPDNYYQVLLKLQHGMRG